jgi:MoaA/NifB/PqqE/SkfB family radical SAM enzyme
VRRSLARANAVLNQLEVATRRARLFSRPVELAIEPTNECNSECSMCTNPRSRRDGTPIGKMQWDTFNRTRPLWRYARTVELSGNGEPLLNPHYLAMARELKQAGRFVHCYTNGILLDGGIAEELVRMGFDKIGVSIGGVSPSTYRRVRGVDALDRVVENLAGLRDAKATAATGRPEVHFNVAAMNSTLEELVPMVRLAARLGVCAIDMFHLIVYYDEVRAESPWLNVPRSEALLAEASEVASGLGIKLGIPSFEPGQVFCREPFRRFLVTWDGLVVSCVGHRFILGDVRDETPAAIWNGKPWTSLRLKVRGSGYGAVCPGCNTCCANDPQLLLDASRGCERSTIDLRTEAL